MVATTIKARNPISGIEIGRSGPELRAMTLPLTSEMVERLDAAKLPGEDRLTVIRKGIERELKARERQKPDKASEKGA